MASNLRFEEIVSHSLLEEMSRALRSQWRTLAEKLGYQFKFIQDFEREPEPVYKMLYEWSKTPNATVENLEIALNKINNFTAYSLVKKARSGKFEPQIRQDFSSPQTIQNDNNNHSHQSNNASNENQVQNAGSGMPPKLQEKVEARALCDLHTHLLGMGSPAFWIDTVMRTNIPVYQAQHLTVSIGASKLVMETVDAATLNDDFHEKFIPKDEKFQNFLKQSWTWTMDVVFSDIALVQAFLGEDVVNDNTMHRVEERFKGIRNKIKLYLVFNQRTQLFEFRNGVSNTDWMAIIQAHPESRKHLEDAFEIDDEHSIFSVGKFTPEFYPRRYILKDCIYSQHLPVLSDLLRFVLRQYTKNGVGYVEFSVGVNDLCKSWVFRHLVIPRNEAQEQRYPMYKFLAAFPRKSAAASDLIKWTTAGIPDIIQYIKARNYEKEFPDSFAALEKLQKSLKEKYQLSDYLVGIDWVGDEYNQPFCVFNSDKFLQFVRERRAATNNQFGMRFHCGENMQFSGVPALIHLGIASQVISDILEKLADVAPIGAPPVLRIGHGVYFTYKPILEDALDPNVQDWLKMAQILQPGMMALQKHHIVLELNLTSNLFLLSSSIAEHARRLVDQFDVIFATDNHGIWSIGNDDCSSVAGELASAVKLNIIPEGSIDAVVDRTRKACFSSLAH